MVVMIMTMMPGEAGDDNNAKESEQAREGEGERGFR